MLRRLYHRTVGFIEGFLVAYLLAGLLLGVCALRTSPDAPRDAALLVATWPVAVAKRAFHQDDLGDW